jgi:enoyl-CoA hydratase/carnithine racemase
MCNKIASKPQEAIHIGKRLFYEQVESDVLSAYDMANNAMAHNMMDECALEGFQAFIEKRDPTWKKVSN